MSGRFFDLAIALAATVAVLSLMTISGAGQTPTAAEKAWNPPRISDGQPDIQGFWDNRGRRLALYNIEEGADEAHVLLRETKRTIKVWLWTLPTAEFLTNRGRGRNGRRSLTTTRT